MADVLLARVDGIEGFERHVVIKCIRGEKATDPQYIKMFVDEARLAARLHHQNIVQVHDIGEDAGDYFFAMEFLHGEDLRKVMLQVVRRKELVPLPYAVPIIASAAAGLHHAHEQRDGTGQPLGIVHRDVSLSNIMVGYDGSVKVTDFGIAKATSRSAQTETGARKGKLAYMSPEQCLGKAIDRRSDVFALGIVLYELVTARRLFKADSDYLVMNAIVLGEIRPPSRLRADVPPALDAIVLRALERKPADRYQTAGDLQVALENIAGELGARATPLASYMVQLFGAPKEPWLVEGDPPAEIDIDFDGSASAVVDAPEAALAESYTPAPSSPLARARAKHETLDPPLPAQAPEPAAAPPHPTRRWPIVAVIATGIAVATTIAIALATGSSPEPPPEPPPSPALPAPAPASTVTLPRAQPPTSPPPSPPATRPAPAAPLALPAPPPKPRPSPIKPKTTPPPQYDPKSLFPQ